MKTNAAQHRLHGVADRASQFHEVIRIYRDANGLCAICGAARGKRNHALDHDHATGRLRGILCGPCNAGIGMFRDNIDLLRKAIEYLERFT